MGAKRFTIVFCLVVLATSDVRAADQIESQSAATRKVAGVTSSTTLPSSTEIVEVEPWIHTRMNDGLRGRVAAGFEKAAELVQEVDSCSDLFTELGVDALETLGSALYWPVISYRDAKEICRGRNLAFTTVGSRMTFICAEFERLSDRAAAMVIIHEALHTAGLRESPQYREHGIKTSHEINSMVSKNCHF